MCAKRERPNSSSVQSRVCNVSNTANQHRGGDADGHPPDGGMDQGSSIPRQNSETLDHAIFHAGHGPDGGE
jgi:hypothetical protein